MARCPVELAQNGIMLSLAEKGEAAIPGLAYNYSADENIAAAAKSMVYNSSFGGILRSNVVSVIGTAGSFEDGIQILLPLLKFSRVKNRPAYISSINLGTSEIEYTPEQNMAIRLAVLQALESIILKKENKNISCPVAGGFGKIVASAALVDPSPRVRDTAAGMLAKYGSPEILSFFLDHINRAFLAGSSTVSQHGEEAVQNMVGAMREDRIRGSVVSAFLNCADTKDPRLWVVAEKALWNLFVGAEHQDKKDLQWHLEEMRIKLTMGSKKGTYGHPEMVMERWLEVSRNMENLLGPAKMEPKKSGAGQKPTKPMRPDKDAFVRPPKKMRGKARANAEMDDVPYVPRGPAVEFVRKLGRVLAKPFRGPRK